MVFWERKYLILAFVFDFLCFEKITKTTIQSCYKSVMMNEGFNFLSANAS